jgi:hypothetical protein
MQMHGYTSKYSLESPFLEDHQIPEEPSTHEEALATQVIQLSHYRSRDQMSIGLSSNDLVSHLSSEKHDTADT